MSIKILSKEKEKILINEIFKFYNKLKNNKKLFLAFSFPKFNDNIIYDFHVSDNKYNFNKIKIICLSENYFLVILVKDITITKCNYIGFDKGHKKFTGEQLFYELKKISNLISFDKHII